MQCEAIQQLGEHLSHRRTHKHDASRGYGAPLAAAAVDKHADSNLAADEARHLRVVERMQKCLRAVLVLLRTKHWWETINLL